MLASQVSNKSPRFGPFCISQSIIRIEPDRLIKVTDGFAIILQIPALKMEMPLQVSVVRFHTVGDHLSRFFLRAEQGNPERLSNGPRDFLLNRENIFQFVVK